MPSRYMRKTIVALVAAFAAGAGLARFLSPREANAQSTPAAWEVECHDANKVPEFTARGWEVVNVVAFPTTLYLNVDPPSPGRVQVVRGGQQVGWAVCLKHAKSPPAPQSK